MKVVVAGGGTAGHVFPAISLAQRLAADHGVEVSYLGTASGLEARLVPEAGIPFTAVEAKPFARKLSATTLATPAILARSVRACRPLIAGADVVVGMGGYVSVPPVVAAARDKRHIVLHEQNAVPGLANRFLARFADEVAVSFQDAGRRFPKSVSVTVTGNPVRARILRVPLDREELAREALAAFGFESGRRTIVAFGGSQGALRLDLALAGTFGVLSERDDLQMLVLTGPAHLDLVTARLSDSGAMRVRALPFLDRMELAYAVADLVVARAGATSIAEIAVCGSASILVPYPHATADHQSANARELERSGGARVISDADLDPRDLAMRIVSLIDDPFALKQMGSAAAGWGRPDATEALADLVMGVGG